MKTFKDVKDKYLLKLWKLQDLGPETPLGQVYEFIAWKLGNDGYEGATAGKVRNKIKRLLKRQPSFPQVPTQRDYKNSRKVTDDEDEIT